MSPLPTRRVLAGLVVVLSCAAAVAGPTVASAAPAQVTTTVDGAAEALRRDPVYVVEGAERALSDADAEALRSQIRSSGEPIFVAVLPGSVAPSSSDADALPGTLARATGLAGTYAVVVGDRFRATSDQVADAGGLATASFQEAASGGAAAVLQRFVERVGSAEDGGSSTGGASGGGGSETSNGEAGGSLVPLALLGAGAGALWVRSGRKRRRRQQEDQAELAADVQLLRAELAVLSDDVLRLEPEVALHPDARLDYDAAVQRFRAASAALDYADDPLDLVRVERVVDEARYTMARAQAIVRGHEPPPPPEHLQRPGRHDEPPLGIDEQGVPVYIGMGPMYGGGWFGGGGGGGLFSGLLLGSMLGGWGWGGGFGHHHDGGGFFGGGDGGGFGGGDFGGGFGGGDWGGGGGDVGGGDW